MNLRQLEVDQSAVITTVDGEGGLRQHFLDMGIIAGTVIKVQRYAPLGDPMEVMVHGYALTLRLAEAERIEVVPVEDVVATSGPDNIDEPYSTSLHDHYAHPGIGEAGKYHDKTHEHPLPKEEQLTIALVGQPNCGKTTLFNQLTGTNQHVGNFPGVTVDRKDGTIKGYPETIITDLPGIYSLSPYSVEERVSRDHIINSRPRCIINIVDAGNMERSLYLTMQLMELDVPVVMAVNMIDEIRANGGSIRINDMEALLGIPVVPISAMKNEGVDELVEHALHIARYQELPARHDFCDKDDNGGSVHRCLHAVRHLIEHRASDANMPLHFAATKIVEGDESIIEALNLSDSERAMVDSIVKQMEQERHLDHAAAIADMRYNFIEKLCRQTVIKPQISKEYRRSQKIDSILTGRWTAIPIFAVVMCLVIWLSIDVLGAPLQDLLDRGITVLAGWVSAGMERVDTSPALCSLVTDGIFGGVGSVLSFVPIIILLFFFLSILEDSGYMARVAFITDRAFRRIGLSGRSIVPMLIGFGCSVPAVMASRTLPSGRDRKFTIMLTPFMSCSAKIPIYGFFCAAFFPKHASLVLIGLYLLGIVLAILYAIVLKLTHWRSEASPFVMELPVYRIPSWRNTWHLLWDKTKDFCSRAFTIIFVATIVIWFLQSFDFTIHMVESDKSMLASIGGFLAPIFTPIGLGTWQMVTALVTGFIAKESVVSTLEVLNTMPLFTIASAMSMLVFCLIYTPCVAAIAAIRREVGTRGAIMVVLVQCVIAWAVSFLVYWLTVAIVG